MFESTIDQYDEICNLLEEKEELEKLQLIDITLLKQLSNFLQVNQKKFFNINFNKIKQIVNKNK